MLKLVNEGLWRERKIEFWNRLWEDLEIGYLDEDLLPILIEFNMRPKSYTISSCSGRIILSDSEKPWSREETNIVFKKHEPITIDELINVTYKPITKRLWLIVSGPILHISTLDLDEALSILKIARLAGFKHSGILSINKMKGIIVELQTGIRFTQLIKVKNTSLISQSQASILVDIANEILLDGKQALFKLYRELYGNRPKNLDEYIIRYLNEHNIELDKIVQRLYLREDLGENIEFI